MVAAAELGEHIGDNTMLRLDRALGWQDGSIEAMRTTGADPVEIGGEPAPARTGLLRRSKEPVDIDARVGTLLAAWHAGREAYEAEYQRIMRKLGPEIFGEVMDRFEAIVDAEQQREAYGG